MEKKDLYKELSKVYKKRRFTCFLNRNTHSSKHCDKYEEMLKILCDADLQEMKAIKFYVESDVNGISNLIKVFGIEIAFIVGIATNFLDNNNNVVVFIAITLFTIIIIMFVTLFSDNRRNKNKYISLVINDLFATRNIKIK